MTLNTDQLTRLADYIQEMKDCQSVAGTLTSTVWCDYVNAWINPGDTFSGYVKDGGERPVRPHPAP